MATGRAMTIFAAVAHQVGRFLQTQITGCIGKEPLRFPARYVTAKTLGIEVPRRIEMDESIGGMCVWRFLVHRAGFGMARCTGLAAGKLAAGWMRRGSKS